MQFGGNDQWSNIIGGVELNRRCDNRDVDVYKRQELDAILAELSDSETPLDRSLVL